MASQINSANIQTPQLVGNSSTLAFGLNNHVMTDANYTLLAADYVNTIQQFTGTLTAGRNIVFPLTAGTQITVFNNTTGGFALTVISASGTGIAIAAGKRAICYCDGTNWVRVTADT